MTKVMETAMKNNQPMETAMMEKKQIIQKIKLNENHTVKYLEKLKETTYKNEKVVFILPNGREYK